MRAYLPDYELKAPSTLDEVLQCLSKEPGVWKPFAGGTDIMILFEAGKLKHRKFLSLWHLDSLRGIEVTSSHVTLKALTTYAEIREHAILQKEFPLLVRAAAETGAVAIQNRGTVGGNIVNASPAADSPPALLVYEAEVECVSAQGSRWVPYASFHKAYKETVLTPQEILSRVRIPRGTLFEKSFYRKVGTRKAQAISKVCLCGVKNQSGDVLSDVRIAVGAVAPIPLRAVKTEALLRGSRVDAPLIRKAREELLREIVPISDIRSTDAYRKLVATNVLQEFLES